MILQPGRLKISNDAVMHLHLLCLLKENGAQSLRRASPAGNEGTLQASAANHASCN